MGKDRKVGDPQSTAGADTPGNISFVCEVYKVQTLVDGGIRVTLDLPETAIKEAAMLMECKRVGVALNVNCKEVI